MSGVFDQRTCLLYLEQSQLSENELEIGEKLGRVAQLRLNLKSSVGWCLECVIVAFRQGEMRRNNLLLQRIATQ